MLYRKSLDSFLINITVDDIGARPGAALSLPLPVGFRKGLDGWVGCIMMTCDSIELFAFWVRILLA